MKHLPKYGVKLATILDFLMVFVLLHTWYWSDMLPNVFIWFLDQENIGLDPQIMILHGVISEILEITDFEAAILKNGWN